MSATPPAPPTSRTRIGSRSNMARGNQRDKAREANQKKMADQARFSAIKSGSGPEPWLTKEKVAAKMREKQAAADAKKQAEAAAGKK
ncbi:hypothetical protein JHW43_003164 [Diplocarpon mali]|nr:hypothetical protein JHW43_003164 [Diplocarpon mali]